MAEKAQVLVPSELWARLLANPMLYGAYRDNPAYCEAYIDKETFDKLQDVTTRNVKENTADKRAYYFTGLLLCTVCGNRLAGTCSMQKTKAGNVYVYKKYRCANYRINNRCTYKKAISENVIERMMLANAEKYLEDAKIRAAEITGTEEAAMQQYNIDEIHDQIDRLNYSWQTGKIRKVEQYEKDFAELMEKLEEAEREHKQVSVKDYSKIEAVLQGGWKEVYNSLDDEHKRSFWRSFIYSIELEDGDSKEIARVNFF